MRLLILTYFLSALAVPTALLAQEPAVQEKPKKEVKRPIQLKGDEYRFGEIYFNKKTREIRFAAEVIQNEVVLEYGLVHAITGKVHESLFATEINPIDLQIVMKLLRYKESKRDIWPVYNEEGEIARKMEDDGKGRVEFLVTTTDAAGKKRTFPMSDWIERREGEEGEKRVKMPKGRFTYTGSDIWEGSYIAQNEGAFAAIYRYAGAMFNSFQDLSDNDDVWFPAEGKVPKIGTKVELTIKPMPDEKPSAGWKDPKPGEERKAKDQFEPGEPTN